MCLAGSINIPGLGGEIGLIKPIWVAGGGGQAGSHMDAFRQGGMGGTGGSVSIKIRIKEFRTAGP